jgi:hypothetical protein
VSTPVILIAAPAHQPALRDRLGGDAVQAFDDADILAALQAIAERRPRIVVLERLFASTSRGIALVARVHDDPLLADVEVHVVAHDSDYRRVQTRKTGTVSPQAPSVDPHGTRRAARVRIGDAVAVSIDGGEARLIDLSVLGAQVTSSAVLKPSQRVRVNLDDDEGRMRIAGRIIWAAYELPQAGRSAAQYRAGLEFISPDALRLATYAARYAKG